MCSTRTLPRGKANTIAARVRSWYAPDLGSVPYKFGFPPSKVRKQWEKLGELPPLPPAEGVCLNLDLDLNYLSIDLWNYNIFPQAMEGLYNLTATDRAPILDWIDDSSVVAGPLNLKWLAEWSWGGEQNEKDYCEAHDLPFKQYDGPTKEAVDQRVHEMQNYEKRETVPVPEKVNSIITTHYNTTYMPWGILAGIGSLDEQLLRIRHPDIGHNPADEWELETLEELHTTAGEVILSFTKTLELLTELQRIA